MADLLFWLLVATGFTAALTLVFAMRWLGRTFGLLPGVVHIRLAGGNVRLRQGKCPFISCAVDDKQHVALVDELIVLDAHLVDKPGYIGGDRHDVGLHPRVARPGR